MRGIKRFIKKVFNDGEFNGCDFILLDTKKHDNPKDDLYLVFACDDNGDLMAKIAYNTDDLQCDYDIDWYEPTNKDGDLLGNEWYAIKECWNIDELEHAVKLTYGYIRSTHWKNQY